MRCASAIAARLSSYHNRITVLHELLSLPPCFTHIFVVTDIINVVSMPLSLSPSPPVSSAMEILNFSSSSSACSSSSSSSSFSSSSFPSTSSYSSPTCFPSSSSVSSSSSSFSSASSFPSTSSYSSSTCFPSSSSSSSVSSVIANKLLYSH